MVPWKDVNKKEFLMYKWHNARGYYVANKSNSNGYATSSQPQLVNIADQNIVSSPEQYDLSIEDKVNAMCRVVGEIAEQVMTIQSNQSNQNSSYKINNIESNVQNVQYDTQNILGQINRVTQAAESIARTPFNMDDIKLNVDRMKNDLSQVMADAKAPENVELISVVKTLISLAKSDKLNDLYKVMRILTDK